MFPTHRFTLLAAALPLLAAAVLLSALFAAHGSLRAPSQWNLLALATDACIVVMAALWLLVLLGSHAAGRATALLALGLGGLLLGAWCGCLQQVFALDSGVAWTVLAARAATWGALGCLAWGLLEWWRQRRRRRRGALAEQRQRLLRERHCLDPLTQVGDADCLREQLQLAHRRGGANCTLLMLDIDRFHHVNRVHGRQEGDRLLQAITRVLQLNLRPDDLLCRYAGDRFGVLLGDTGAEQARAVAEQLRRAVGALRHHAQHGGAPLQVSLRYVLNTLEGDPRLLLRLANRALERPMVRADSDKAAARIA
ncbi:MAG: GGDEF domain-containing protein [Gammaproteobacteria bacterium]